MIDRHKRSQALWRRFVFEALNGIGFFRRIERMSWFNIKEPWKTLYERTRSKN